MLLWGAYVRQISVDTVLGKMGEHVLERWIERLRSEEKERRNFD